VKQMAEPRQRHPGGRPTSFDEQKAETIVELLRAGNYIDVAAAYAGISRATLYNWLRQGARHKTPELAQFAADVEQARAEAELRNVAIISNAAATNWQAAAWWLERTALRRWGRRYEFTMADVREAAREAAEAEGLPPDEVVREAEAWIREQKRRSRGI
jgi:transposase